VVDGAAAGYLRRGERELLLFMPEAEPARSKVVREVARALMSFAATAPEGRRGMLLAEINGAPATTHIAARLFTDEGFASTAMGLQARTERLRPHGFAPAGIDIAEAADGGTMMADNDNRTSSPPRNQDADMGRAPVRSSNDRNPTPEREGIESERRRSDDDAAKGMGDDVDPDSAESENDRDDMITE
jgi:hypothetical protein